MDWNLDNYGGEYTPKWLEGKKEGKKPNLTFSKKTPSGKRQWYVAGFTLASVETIPTVEKYAKCKILEALNSEDNFRAMMCLKQKWKGGIVKECMDDEIKQGTYSLERCIEYTSKKGFTGFYDKNDPTFRLRIPAERCENIRNLVELGANSELIYETMTDLPCTLKELEEYIHLNREGILDNAFKFIASKSRTDEGYIDYVRKEVEPLFNKHLFDFKIREEE